MASGLPARMRTPNGEERALTFVWTLAEIEDNLGPERTPTCSPRPMRCLGQRATGKGGRSCRQVRSDGTSSPGIWARPSTEGQRTCAGAPCRRLLAIDAPGARSRHATTRRSRRWDGLMLAAFADAATSLRGRTRSRRNAALGAKLARDAPRRPPTRLLDAFRTPGWPARPVVEGWSRQSERRARGLRALRRGAARPVRGDVRRALVHRCAGAQRSRSWPISADPAGGFFDTSDQHETLVTRPRADLQDNAPALRERDGRHPCCSISARSPARLDTATRPNGRSDRSARSSTATRWRSASGSSPSSSHWHWSRDRDRGTPRRPRDPIVGDRPGWIPPNQVIALAPAAAPRRHDRVAARTAPDRRSRDRRRLPGSPDDRAGRTRGSTGRARHRLIKDWLISLPIRTARSTLRLAIRLVHRR